jgi:UDP-N-acetyl-D-mannosaminuronic acid transferase (WecB/TagA/CpsF family)
VSGYEGDEHFPTQFNRIPRWMTVQLENFPGSLLLVGAGVVGKIYCNWWRDLGGVAFDVGGCMDIFAGKVTRGPDRGLDKDDPNPIHKL